MKMYLLSVYQPDGAPPPPDILKPIMQKVHALQDELKAAGAWVFCRRAARSEHGHGRARQGWRCRHDRWSVHRGQRTHRRIHRSSRRPISMRHSSGDAKLARATTLPIEVRPFQDQH